MHSEMVDVTVEAVSPAEPIEKISILADVQHVEAPVTISAYLMCAFAAFGGVFFGYDSGYIGGCLGMDYFIHEFTGLPYPPETPRSYFQVPSTQKSLIVSILSAGTFVGALMAGDLADLFGRRTTIIAGCVIFTLGCILQTASTTYSLLIAGRVISGIGVGFESATIITYMSEVAPRKVRGAIVAGYQFCITIGLFLAACVTYGTQHSTNSGSYRIPIALQMLWALILGGGLFLLPESPRFFVKKGKIDSAIAVLARLRGQPAESTYIKHEINEIIANHELEVQASSGARKGYFNSWMRCFQGSITDPASNLRRTILGTSLQMLQQWTGVQFIFYFGTTFFQSLGSISNPFLISIITSLVNICSTPISFWAVEKMGRRSILLIGAAGMIVSELLVAVIGTAAPNNATATRAEIALICVFIFFFASTWGPGAWVCIGEVYPLSIRSRGVALSTASNWFWNCIISVISPYLVYSDYADLGPKVFFLFGGLCIFSFIFTYFCVPETKGLTLEQVDMMLAETTARTSAKWKPTTTFAAEVSEMVNKDGSNVQQVERHP